MKALKLSAVIFTALLALSACKTAPGGNTPGGNTPGSADAKVQEGLNDALGQVGSVAGMTGYTQKGSTAEGTFTYSFSQEIYFDSLTDPKSFKQASSTVYNGITEYDGAQLTFDNEIVSKDATTAGVKLLVKDTDYTPSYKYQETNSDGSTADVTLTDTDVAGYIFIELTDPANKMWSSPKSGGTGEWKDGGSYGNQAYILKVDGTKLYFMSIYIDNISSPKLVRLNGDPRSPSADNTYTKK